MATEQNHALETFGGWREEETEFTKELSQMQLVAAYDEGGGYDWEVFYVYYHTGRDRFYYIEGSGCSCNWIGEYASSLGDFQDAATKEEVAKYFKSEYTVYEYSSRTQQGIDAVHNDIINFKK